MAATHGSGSESTRFGVGPAPRSQYDRTGVGNRDRRRYDRHHARQRGLGGDDVADLLRFWGVAPRAAAANRSESRLILRGPRKISTSFVSSPTGGNSMALLSEVVDSSRVPRIGPYSQA